MGKARLDPARPPTLSQATRARLDAMTPAEILRNAESDADNPPFTQLELETVRIARAVQAVRRGRGMSQAAFAQTYRIAAGTLRDWEQGRRRPDTAALAYLETIRHEPEAVERALAHGEVSP